MKILSLFLMFLLLVLAVIAERADAVPGIRGEYSGSYTTVVSNCTASEDDGTYDAVLAMNISTQTGNNFSGSATGTFDLDGFAAKEYIQLSGTITETGQISGNTSHTFLATGGEGTFTGQLRGDTLTIENPGHDTYGDTCTYIRTMSATREGGTTPSANFSANPTSGNTPLSVNFTDESTGTITSWNWDFGDGASSSIQNPSHIYTNEGKYSVGLTVSGPYGSDSETKTDYISIQAMPFSDVIYESALLGPTGINGGSAIGNTTTNQWMLGSRFFLSTETQITAVGGHIGNMSLKDGQFNPDARIYVAIVPLQSKAALPSFLPSELEAHALAAKTFIPGNTLASSINLSIAISISLQPGYYGLIFGTGLWGTTGSAAMPTNNSLLPGASFFLGTTNDFWNPIYADTLGMRFFVKGILMPKNLKAMPWIPLLLLDD